VVAVRNGAISQSEDISLLSKCGRRIGIIA
jgi:hypothetical protein